MVPPSLHHKAQSFLEIQLKQHRAQHLEQLMNYVMNGFHQPRQT